MKRLIAIILVLTITNTFLISQNNGGFENWTVVNGKDEPDNWQTLNILSLFGNPVSAFKVGGVDKYSGNYALKITSVAMPYKVLPQLPDTFGYAFNGKAIISPPSLISGSPYTNRPEKISFYAKYIPVGLDTGLVGIVLHRNTPTVRDTIAFNRYKILPNATYTNFNITLNYRSNAIPDSADIYFKPSSTDSVARRVGSALFIDDVAFIDFVGVKENELYAAKVKLFPNPAVDVITITAKFDEADKVEIMDFVGKNIATYKIENYTAKINTSEFKTGVYIYKIVDKKNKALTFGKFNVLK